MGQGQFPFPGRREIATGGFLKMESLDTLNYQKQEALQAEIEQDRRQELLMDALSGEPETDICFHNPDTLDLIDMEYGEDEVVCLFQCTCGKTVKEIFKHFDTVFSD